MNRRLQSSFLLLVLLLWPTIASAAGVSDIVSRGKLRIGVCEFLPWTFTDRAGQLEGFEIDIGRTIAQDMGVEPEFKVYSLDAILGAVDRGEIDFIAAGLAITPGRALQIEFSSPYFESGATVVTNKKLTSNIKTVDDLNREGYVVVTVSNTFSAGLAPQLFDVAAIKTLPDAHSAEKELTEGRAHAYLTNLPDARIIARRNADLLEMPLSDLIVKSVAGFGVRRGNQSLLNFLNAWIAARSADRWLSGMYDYWFSGYDWTLNMKKDED